MSKKYENLAKEIVKLVGGDQNINDVYHCQTRLRFKLVDDDLAETERLEEVDGIAKIIKGAGVYQVVIGTHVKDVFEEVLKFTTKRNVEVIESKQGLLNKMVDFLAGAFGPIIAALSGAGMVKAVLAILTTCNIITNASQTYYLLNMFADAVFYFLPLMLAFTIAQKLKCNPILAVSVGAMMLHPSWNALVTAGEPVLFFGIIPFTLASYTSSVIPIVLVIFVQSYVEKFINKLVPKSVELVIVPLLTFLIMGTLAFSLLGPIGTIIGGFVATIFNFLSVNVSWAPAVIIGGFLPLMVMFGVHSAVAPLGIMQMAELGYDSIFGPGCLCSNIAQATASFVVALRTKDKKIKQLATSGSITAYMGITEPALYGVNLPKKYPLVAAMIGGGLGGLYAGLTQTHRFATGSSGLPAIFLYIGDDTMSFFYNIIIALVITVIATAVITYLLSLKYEKVEIKTENKNLKLMAPLLGKVKPLRECSDEAFASESLGKGIMIEPVEGKVVAPFDGTVVTLFPTKHAIGLVSEEGVEVLIHIGINTVDLSGQYFNSHISQGDIVKKGQTLVEFDMQSIEKEGYSTETLVIITNSHEFSKVEEYSNQDASFTQPVLNLLK